MVNNAPIFSITRTDNTISVTSATKIVLNRFCHFAFCSRLLHSLNADSEGIWNESSELRTDLFIEGFPPHINWTPKSKTEIVGVSNQELSKSFENELAQVISALIGTQASQFENKEITFAVINSKTKCKHTYKFFNGSRTVTALCVLLDGKVHPRNHLEVTLNSEKDLMLKEFSTSPSKMPQRVYSDPSKTVDELRNQGFPRQTDESPRGVSINVTRGNAYGNLQEHYQLLKFEQSIDDRVGRSNIPAKFKRQLYELNNHQCTVCGQTYDAKYLAPDHRVPSIVQHDNLNENNFLRKLQTLCVRCNQVKRESCKKCPYDHNCNTCEWAFPEKFSVSKDNFDILSRSAKKRKMGVNTYLRELFKLDHLL